MNMSCEKDISINIKSTLSLFCSFVTSSTACCSPYQKLDATNFILTQNYAILLIKYSTAFSAVFALT